MYFKPLLKTKIDNEGKNTRNISRAKRLPVKNGGLRF
jgi:hypothetical protein